MLAPQQKLKVDAAADALGTTEDVLQGQTQKWWKYAFDQAKREVESMNEAASIDAYNSKDDKCAVGELVVNFPTREYIWLHQQYGPDFWKDEDFLLCYQKYRNQDFLAKPSKELFT